MLYIYTNMYTHTNIWYILCLVVCAKIADDRGDMLHRRATVVELV